MEQGYKKVQCPTPITVRQDGGFNIVPCGKCEFCLDRKRTEWSFRLNQELKSATSAHFTTMTYSNDNIPLVETCDEDGVFTGYSPTLDKNDIKLFLKKLRSYQDRRIKKRNIEWPKIRYYLVGEYGTKTKRPHYHMIVFNLHRDTVLELGNIWKKGNTKTGSVTPASIHYVTKYVMTKHKYDDNTQKPFAQMSRKPGIGNNYLNSDTKKYHKSDSKNYVQLGEYKQHMPRYYREEIFSRVERDLQNIESVKRADEQFIKHEKKYLKKGVSPYAYRQQQVEDLRRKLSLEQNKKL